ncbi:MAG: histidine kinase [Gemmiger sp.]|nr:histidine kinase [Gemmiger sp.]
MKPLKKLLNRIPFSWQMTLVICLFALLPMLAFCGYMLSSVYRIAVDTRTQEVRQRAGQLSIQVEKAAELCNLSTQVFLNTPALTDHLAKLKKGESIPAAALLSFYDNDIASLEKVVVSNPYLYQIRVYSVTDAMSEMLPLLYSASRMQRMPWAESEVASGSWMLDFDDQLYPSYAVTHHIMSLITEINTAAEGKVGTLEVAMRMEELLPELFAENSTTRTFLTDLNGNLLVGQNQDDALQALAEPIDTLLQNPSGGTAQVSLHGEPFLLTVQPLTSIGCRYLQLTTLADLRQSSAARTGYVLLALALVFILLLAFVGRLSKRMLRQFYLAFDAVRNFSQGDLEAAVPEDPNADSEVGRFAGGINQMLDRIRQLMQDNVNRELLAKNAELRALQNQINAHFIYNVLEAIKMMAEIDEKYEIADAVTSLGKLLRYSMKWNSKNVTVAQEVENIQNYLSLMNLRFDFVITLKLEIPPALLEQSIPKMSLQPVVENAVVHGVVEMDADAEILLRGLPGENDYKLEIVDHGKGMTPAMVVRLEQQIAGEICPDGGAGNGLGLKNVQDRIRMMFGEPYGLSVSSAAEEFTCVTLLLPYTTHEGENL